MGTDLQHVTIEGHRVGHRMAGNGPRLRITGGPAVRRGVRRGRTVRYPVVGPPVDDVVDPCAPPGTCRRPPTTRPVPA